MTSTDGKIAERGILSAINRLYRIIPCVRLSVHAYVCIDTYVRVHTSEPNPVGVRRDSLLAHTGVLRMHVRPDYA